MKTEKKQILIADPDHKTHNKIKQSRLAKHYHFESAFEGSECLKKIDNAPPDLILLNLMLPHIHGIEILRKIKTDPRTDHIGIIITTSHMMIQNYYSALIQHADYFLEKPFENEAIFPIFKLFFEGKLHPAPFVRKDFEQPKGKHCYLPKVHPPTAYIKFWGTRGSNPVSGTEYIRFGGNTSCLEVRNENDLIILDAGTGIRPLGISLEHSKPKNIHILFSHTHWDHIVGFPFFLPLYDPNCNVHIWTPIGFEKTARELFTQMLAYSYFPVRLDDIQATLSFKEMKEGEPFEIGKFKINTHYAFHPGATLCFKISTANKTFGYITDNEILMGYHGHPGAIKKSDPLLAPYLSQINFFKDCDFLIHEAQYTPKEYQTKVGWGHSSISNAAILLKMAAVSEWIVTHHDPQHSDSDLLKKAQLQQNILDDCKLKCRMTMAFDDLVIPLS